MLTLLVGILLIVIAMPVKKTKTKDVPVEAGTENSYEDEYEEDDFEEDYRNGPEKEIYWDDEEEAPWNGRKNIRYPKGK